MHEGFLCKRASTGFRLLQRRYFRLTGDGLLMYYKSDAPTEKAQGIIKMLAVKSCKLSGGRGRGRLHLEVDRRPMRKDRIICDDVDEAVRWDAALTNALAPNTALLHPSARLPVAGLASSVII